MEFVAVAAPIICLIDCVVLPVASAILPFIGMTKFAHGINDQMLAFLVLAICLPIIVPGFMRHRSKRVLGLFVCAIFLMFFVNFAGAMIDEAVHTCISLLVACLLIKANRENKQLLGCLCAAHSHSHEHNDQTTVIDFAPPVAAHHEHSAACNHDHEIVHHHVHFHRAEHIPAAEHTENHTHAEGEVCNHEHQSGAAFVKVEICRH